MSKMPSKIEFNSLESCLIELNHIANRLRNAIEIERDGFDEINKILHEYSDNLPERIQKGDYSMDDIHKGIEELNKKPETKKIKKMAGILSDYVAIHLHNFIEIHSLVAVHLKNIGEIDLEKSLHEFWKPIQSMDSRIRRWRNNAIAHSENIAKEHRALYEIDEEYEKLHKELFFASICAIMYCSGIASNLPEYSDAIDSHRRQIQYEKNAFKISEWLEINEKIKKTTVVVEKELEKNGYIGFIHFSKNQKYP